MMLEPPSEQLRQRAKHPIASTSSWDDEIWIFEVANPSAPNWQRTVKWNVIMADETSLTEPKWKPWSEAMKIAIWSLAVDPPEGHKPRRPISQVTLQRSMCVLVQWMHDNGYKRLNQLTPEGRRRFMSYVKQRRGRDNPEQTVKMRVITQYQSMLDLLWLQGRRYPELAVAEAAPKDVIVVSWDRNDTEQIPRTPEPVAIALIAGAIRLLDDPADDIIEARDRVLKLYEEAKSKPGRSRPITYVRKQLATKPLAWRRSKQEGWYEETEDDLAQVGNLARILRYAAFVILSYLVGMRVSEILALEAGCITKRPSLSGEETHTFITGRIFKTAPTDEGVAHEWIAPPIAERAVQVLERLSEPLRKRSGRPNIWLHQTSKGVYGGTHKIEVQKSNSINDRLNDSLAPFIGLPLHDGKQWHLTSHQGRKTFAYLVAKQDRTGLHALKEHLGHRSIVMTDHSYSGRDHEMRKLIGEAAMDEMIHAFADALTATELAGKAGKEIVARSPFRGQLVTEGLLNYLRQRLRDTGQYFEVCDYGYCYYNERQAACDGDRHGPNHAIRTQSVCIECRNFVVTPKHLHVWEDRKRSYEVVLEQTEMSTDTQAAVRRKVAECERVIQQLRKQAQMQ